MADKSCARKARREQCSQVKVVFDAMIKVAQAFLLILLSFFAFLQSSSNLLTALKIEWR